MSRRDMQRRTWIVFSASMLLWAVGLYLVGLGDFEAPVRIFGGVLCAIGFVGWLHAGNRMVRGK